MKNTLTILAAILLLTLTSTLYSDDWAKAKDSEKNSEYGSYSAYDYSDHSYSEYDTIPREFKLFAGHDLDKKLTEWRKGKRFRYFHLDYQMSRTGESVEHSVLVSFTLAPPPVPEKVK